MATTMESNTSNRANLDQPPNHPPSSGHTKPTNALEILDDSERKLPAWACLPSSIWHRDLPSSTAKGEVSDIQSGPDPRWTMPRSGLTTSPAPSSVNDSLTRSRNANLVNFSTAREHQISGTSNIWRDTTLLDAHLAVGGPPSHMPRGSPRRQRSELHGTSMMTAQISTLSNATLLNGSAPDIEPISSESFAATAARRSRNRVASRSGTGLKNMNMSTVSEFVPFQQQSRRQEVISRGAYHNSANGTAPHSLRGFGSGTSKAHSSCTSSGALAPLMLDHAVLPSCTAYSHNGRCGPRRPSLEDHEQSLRSDGYSDFVAHNDGYKHDVTLYLSAAMAGWQFDGSPVCPPNFSSTHFQSGYTTATQPTLSGGHRYLFGGETQSSTSRGSVATSQSREGSAGRSSSGSNDPFLNSNRASAADAGDVGTISGTSTWLSTTTDGSHEVESRRNLSRSGSQSNPSAQDDDRIHAPASNHVSSMPYYASGPQLPHDQATSQISYQYPLAHPSYRYVGDGTSIYPTYSARMLPNQPNLGASIPDAPAVTEKRIHSPLMEDFLANYKNTKYELPDLQGHIVEFSGDALGSRYIQMKLETASNDQKEQVFNEIKREAVQLMKDPYGNYVVQKLFELGTQAQKKILAHYMTGRILFLTVHHYGCRVVQKALDHVLTDQQAMLVQELEGQVLNIVEDQNGNHVIQKIIECVPGEHIRFVFAEHRGHVVRLSKHNYGCRVIQRMLEFGSLDVKQNILEELKDHIASLISDQYGNYVMQHIIQHGEPADRLRVVTHIQQQLLTFSRHKFASNVVEAAIKRTDNEQRQLMIHKLTTGIDPSGQSQLFSLIRDQFGNYVIKRILKTMEGPTRAALGWEIWHLLPQLRKVSHGKQVAAMEKTLAEIGIGAGARHHNHPEHGILNGVAASPRSTLGRGAFHGQFRA